MEPYPPIPAKIPVQAPVTAQVNPVATPVIVPPMCPQCHAVVRPTDFFCYNCGKNLKPAPPSTSFEKLFMYYLGTLLLPPMGIWWGIKYVRSGNEKAKLHGWIMIVGTVVLLIFLTIWTTQFVNTITTQVNSQMNGQLNGASLQGL